MEKYLKEDIKYSVWYLLIIAVTVYVPTILSFFDVIERVDTNGLWFIATYASFAAAAIVPLVYGLKHSFGLTLVVTTPVVLTVASLFTGVDCEVNLVWTLYFSGVALASNLFGTGVRALYRKKN